MQEGLDMAEPAVSPAVEQLLKTLGGGKGWAGLDPLSPDNAQAMAKQAAERFERARIVAGPFLSQAGAAALDELRRMTIEDAAWQPDALGLPNAIGFGIYREGQNSIVRYIERMIEVAQQGPGGDAAAPVRKRRR